jgi:glutaredoxin-like YruB-family protein
MIVKLFSTPCCPVCQTLKEFLKENEIEFEDKDVSKDNSAREEMMDRAGVISVPVLLIDDIIIVGFDLKTIKKVLNIK